MSDSYVYLHLAAPEQSSTELAKALGGACLRSWHERGAEVWGMFSGLFGLDSNELVVILNNAADVPPAALAEPVTNARVLQVLQLQARARPTVFAPLAEPGLYVLRHFRLQPSAVAETVRLSRQAWESFETDADFHTRPLGLFEQTQPTESHYENMLLVTWYDGFESWERSRKPAPEAQDNFRARHALTTRTGAVATRLLSSHKL